MAFCAKINKRRFKGRFNASDLALVDIGLFLLASARFNIQIIHFLAVDQSNAQLFRLGCVNQHSFHAVRSAHMVSRVPCWQCCGDCSHYQNIYGCLVSGLGRNTRTYQEPNTRHRGDYTSVTTGTATCSRKRICRGTAPPCHCSASGIPSGRFCLVVIP